MIQDQMQQLILEGQRELRDDVKAMRQDVQEQSVQIAKLEQRVQGSAAIWGALAGAVPVALGVLAEFFIKRGG